MTLSDMASFVTGKIGRTDSDSVSKCKEFLARRYELIWNSQLWRESLATATQSVSADTQDVTLADSNIDQIVAVRWSDTTLGPVAHEQVFAIDPTLFDGSGTPLAFVTLPKTADGYVRLRLVQKPNTTKNITILGKVKLRVIDSSNAYVTRNLEQSTDKPALSNIDNALLCFAEADMLTRERQYSKAQMMQAEAVAQIKVAVGVEKNQSANNLQVLAVDSGEWTRDDWDSGATQTGSYNFLGIG